MEEREVLKSARETLELQPEEVERGLALEPGTVVGIEQGRIDPETSLLFELATFYGLSAEELVTGVTLPELVRPIRALSLDPDRRWARGTELSIARIALARRELRSLEDELGLRDRHAELRKQFRHEGNYLGEGRTWEEGRHLATLARGHLDIPEDQPISSMRTLLENLGIELIGVRLPDRNLAGFSLADPVHGPAIVYNLLGPNENLFVRRFTLAHELCHVLFDELVHEDVFQSYGSFEDEPEQRANAFAACFLAPDQAIRSYLLERSRQDPTLEQELALVMNHFGINFKVARFRLIHAWQVEKSEAYAVRNVRTDPEDRIRWRKAEAQHDDEFFPCGSVPLERRYYFARTVARAARTGALDRGQAYRYLSASILEDIGLIF